MCNNLVLFQMFFGADFPPKFNLIMMKSSREIVLVWLSFSPLSCLGKG